MSQKPKLPPLKALNNLMKPDYREQVVSRAIGYLKSGQAKPQRLDKALKRVVCIHGFSMRLTTAPPSSLIPATVAAFQDSDEVVAAVLLLWQEANQELCALLDDFLAAQGVNRIEAAQLGKSFVGFHSEQEMKTHLASFQGKNPTFDENDVHLMYICRRGTLPVPANLIINEENKVVSQKQSENGFIWAAWLEQLNSLPPEASEWAVIDEFIGKIKTLAEQKSQERQGVTRLQNALDELCQEASQLEFIEEFAGCREWQVTQCSPDQVILATEKITTLAQTFREYSQLEQQPPPRKLSEKKAWYQKLSTLSDQATQIYQELQVIFGPVEVTPLAKQMVELRPDQTEDEAGDEDDEPSHTIQEELANRTELTPGSPDGLELPESHIDGAEMIPQGTSVVIAAEPAELMEVITSPSIVSIEDVSIEENSSEESPAQISQREMRPFNKIDTSPSPSVLETTEESIFPKESSLIIPLVPISEPLSPEDLVKLVQETLPKWMACWSDLPKAYLLTTWLRMERATLANNYPSPELCEIAYYALQPTPEQMKGARPVSECPNLNLLWTLLENGSDELKGAAWELAAALVTLRGDIASQDLLEYRFEWANKPEFRPWSRMAEVIHVYWSQASETIYEVQRSLQASQRQTHLKEDSVKAQNAAREALFLLEKPGKSQHLRNSFIRERLSWLPEALKKDAPDKQLTEWARRFKPDHDLQRWGEEDIGYRLDWSQPDMRQIIRNFQTLHTNVSRWIKLDLSLQDDQTRQTVNDAFKYCVQAILREGQEWRIGWVNVGGKWPTLAGWSEILLQRFEEVATATNQSV